MSSENPHRTLTPSLEQLELKESQLCRESLLLLTLLAAALAASSWEPLRTLPQRLEALPIGVVLLIGLFAAYAWTQKGQITELRGSVRDLQRRVAFQPIEDQLDQWIESLSASERWLHDFIDSLDEVVVGVSLAGEIVAVNRRFSELVGQPLSEVIGHCLDEFLDEPNRATIEKAIPQFLKLGHWSGTVRVRVKKTGAVGHFDCVFRTMVKNDRVIGITALACDLRSVSDQPLRASCGMRSPRVLSRAGRESSARHRELTVV